jgi:hypothetical protein
MANCGRQNARCKTQSAKWAAVLAFAFCTLTSALASEIETLVESAPGHEVYPEAGALILLDRKVVTVDKNNNGTMERYLVVKIFEDRGRDEFGDISQRFNKDGQVCEVLEARTHKPDGSVVKPEARAISDVSAPEVYDAMAYTNAMLKVVSFPALEKDAVIEYRVRVKPKRSTKEDGFSGLVKFGGLYPALKREFTLIVPAGTHLRWGWNGTSDTVAPKVVTAIDGGPETYYRWEFENTPQIFEEPGTPDIARLVPVLSYSSWKDWNQVAAKLRKDFDKGLVPSPAVKQLSDSLAAGKSGPDALRDIYLHVTQRFRNVALDYGTVGYEPHKAAKVIEWKYGDCRDKNCLLIALLKEAGINVFPVVLSRDRVPVAKDVPSPDAFDWLATMALIPDSSSGSGQSQVGNRQSEILLDPFAEYCPFGSVPGEDAGGDALYLDAGTGGLTSLPERGSVPDVGRTVADVALDLNGDLSGAVASELQGSYDSDVREYWRDQTPTDRRRSMAQTASGIKTGAQIDTFWFSDLIDLTKPATAGFRFTAPRYAVTQKGELSMRVPTPAVVGDPLFGITSSARRTNPVETKPARLYVYECSIKLPPGVKVDILPDSVMLDNDCCSAQGGWARTADGVSFGYALTVKKTDVPVADYGQLKAVTDALTKPQLREVYFLK